MIWRHFKRTKLFSFSIYKLFYYFKTSKPRRESRDYRRASIWAFIEKSRRHNNIYHNACALYKQQRIALYLLIRFFFFFGYCGVEHGVEYKKTYLLKQKKIYMILNQRSVLYIHIRMFNRRVWLIGTII